MTNNALIGKQNDEGGTRLRSLSGTGGGIAFSGFGPSSAQLKQYFATGRVPREQDFTTLLQIAEIGRLITSQSPDQPPGGAFGLTIGATGKFEVTSEFLKGLVSVEAFAALPIEDRKAIYDLLVESAGEGTLSTKQSTAIVPPSMTKKENPVGPPIGDLLTLFAEGTVQLEGDFGDLIDVADVGRRAAGLAPGQSGTGHGMTIDPMTGRMDFSRDILDGLVSVDAFVRLSDPERAAIYDLLRFARTVFPDPPRSDQAFGATLSLSGDGSTLAVADIYRTVDGYANAGAVDIYRNEPGGWALAQTIENPTPASDYYFGYAVSLPETGTGNLAVSGQRQAGVQLFAYDGAGYEFMTDLMSTVSDPQIYETSVRINGDGNVIAVGYPATTTVGLVSVFTLDSDTGDWSGPATVLPSPGQAAENFGNSVSFDKTGDVLAVGAFKYKGAASDCGRAYIFRQTGGSWQQEKIFDPPQPKTDGSFGMTVTLSGDGNTVAIKCEKIGAANYTGYYLSRRDLASGAWGALDVIFGPEFGSGHLVEGNAAVLSADGDKVALPAPAATVGALEDAGLAYLYAYSSMGWVRERTFVSPDPGSNYQFGACIGARSDMGLVAAGEPNSPMGNVEGAGRVTFFPVETLGAGAVAVSGAAAEARLPDERPTINRD